MKPSLDRFHTAAIFLVLLTLFSATPLRAEKVIFHLQNGDRIEGTIVSENTNQVVITNEWTKSLSIPLSAIKNRDVVRPPPTPTNAVAAVKPAAPTTPVKPAAPKRWKTNLTLGTDLQVGARDRQLFYTRVKLTYEQPYKQAPKKFFRSIIDYSMDYGETDGLRSANRMDGSVKTDFDIDKHWYVYNLGGAGYDEIRKLDLYYEEGPGMGYHLFATEKFIANLEAGGNYQVQEREDGSESKNFFLRFAENVTWKLGKFTLTEKFEFTPRAEDFSRFRFKFDSTLSFPVWKNLSINLSVLDLYDTDPAAGSEKNELLVRSTVGITF